MGVYESARVFVAVVAEFSIRWKVRRTVKTRAKKLRERERERGREGERDREREREMVNEGGSNDICENGLKIRG